MERRNRKQKENKDRSIGDDARIAGKPGGMDNARIKEREEWITKTNTGERMDNTKQKASSGKVGIENRRTEYAEQNTFFYVGIFFFLEHLII